MCKIPWCSFLVCLYFVYGVMAGILVSNCGGNPDDCTRIENAINARAVACDANFRVDGDCSQVDYEGGVEELDACLNAVATAACDDLRTVVRRQCLPLFGKVSL